MPYAGPKYMATVTLRINWIFLCMFLSTIGLEVVNLKSGTTEIRNLLPWLESLVSDFHQESFFSDYRQPKK